MVYALPLSYIIKFIQIESNYKPIFTGLIFILGAILGLGIYTLLKNKKAIIKILILIISYIIILSVLLVCKNNINHPVNDSTKSIIIKDTIKKIGIINNKNLKTCPVCGYISIYPDSNYCSLCYKMVFDSISNNEEKRIKWLKMDQLNWFSALYNENHKVDFYNPKINEGYIKDSLWKPIVTEKEIIDYSKK